MRHKNQSDEFINECIALAYIQLLYQKKKEDITITEICQKAGFGRTTFYRHFSSDLDEIIIYIGKKKWQEHKETHKEVVIKDESGEFLKHIYHYRRFMLMLKEQKMVEVLFRILFELYGIQGNEDPVLRYAKDLFVGMYFGVIYDWILQGCVDTPEEIQNNIKKAFELAVQKNEEKK